MVSWSLTRLPRIHNGERIFSSTNIVLGYLDIQMPKNEIEPLSYSIHKNHLKVKWRLKCKTWNINLLEETIGGNLLDIGLGNEFLDMTPEAEAPKTKINKWDYIKLKSSTQQRELSAKRKGNLGIERTCFQTMYHWVLSPYST